MTKKFNRDHSLIVFYQENWKILFQDRWGISKYWEKYGLFWWGVDIGETFQEACLRETKEELNISLSVSDIKLAASFSKKLTWYGESENHIFIAWYKKEYDDIIQILEGKAGVWWTIEEAKQQVFFNHDYMIFWMLELYFNKYGYAYNE